MKHLRYAGFLLLFCLAPALVAGAALTTWLESSREERVATFDAEAGRLLEEARERILSGTTMQEFAESVVDEIEKRSEFVGGAVQELLAGLEARHPGVLHYQVYLVSVKEGTPPWEGAQGVPLADNIGRGVFEYRQLADRLMRTRLHLERDRAGEKPGHEPLLAPMDPRRERIVQEKLLGRRRSVAYVADRFRDAIAVTREGRPSVLYWDFAYSTDPATRSRHPAALVLLFIDPGAFRAAFEPARVIARLQAESAPAGVTLGLLDGRGDPPAGAPPAAAVASAGVTAAAVAEDAAARYALLRVSEVERTTLYARLDRADLHPDLDRREFLLRSALALFALLFVALTAPAYYGRWKPYIPLRHQVTALFLLASLFPLGGIAWGGLKFLQASRTALEEEAAARLRNRLREADTSASCALDALRRTAQAALDGPECRALAPAPDGAPPAAETLAAFDRLAGRLVSFPEIESCLLLDGSGEVLAGRETSDDPLARALAGALARRILAYVNTGTTEAAQAGTAVPLVERLAALEPGRGRDDAIRARGRLHRLRLLGRELCLFLEPIPDAEGRSERLLALGFSLPRLFSRVLGRFREESERRLALDGLTVAVLPPPGIRDPASESWFGRRPDARALARRAARGAAPSATPLTIDDAPHLAWCAPLRVIEGAVALGAIPLGRIEEELARRRGYFLAFALLTLLGAGLGSTLLSRRILDPLRRVDRAVRALAEGDLEVRMNLDSRDEFGDLSHTFNRMAAGLREKELMSRYVSASVLDEVKRGDAGGAAEVKATIFFSDLRDFTGLAERHPPAEIVEMLNTYLTLVSKAVIEHGGVVDKFIGDAVMAVFYPDERRGGRGDEARAVLAAMRVREAMDGWNARRRAEGRFPVDCGIGINTGEVIKASVGSAEHRVDLTVIGDHVNLAARLEALSRDGRHLRIILSERTARAVSDLVAYEPLETTRVKGKTKEVRLFEVTGPRRAEDYLPRLAAPEPEARREALRLLAAIRDPATAGEIRAALADPDPEVRREAAQALEAFAPDPEGVAALVARSAEDPDPATRAACVRAVRKPGDDEARLALSHALADADDRVRADAVEALGAVRDRGRAVSALRRFLTDPDNRTRANAAVTLFSWGETDALDTLLAMTVTREAPMRASGAWGIGEAVSAPRAGSAEMNHLLSMETFERLERALDRLITLLDDPDPMVLRNAARAIGRLGNRRAVDPLLAACARRTDPEARAALLSALDALGSFGVVRRMRDALDTPA